MCLGDADGNGIDDACEDATNVACCLPDGSCIYVLSAGDCFLIGGWIPPGGVCLGDLDGDGVDDACEQPEEVACCLPDGSCIYVLSPDECFQMGGWIPPGGVCLGDADGNGIDDACEESQGGGLFEFSVDIGSDTELSDPFFDGDEGFDPGDVYWWQGPPVTPPLVPGGRDGFKDDLLIFGFDIMPDPPDGGVPPFTAVPVGEGDHTWFPEFFDLDGHDQIDVPLMEFGLYGQTLEVPIPAWETACIHPPEFLFVSFDDDMAPSWPAFDVPVTVPSPAGVSSYGTTWGQDEVIGLTLAPVLPPAPIVNVYPFADEITVHASLAPNPDNDEDEDDDVDSLDVVPDDYSCEWWYFSPDHEGTGFDPFTGLPLDPGDIYLVMPGAGPILVIDNVNNLGLWPGTDVDAFEFTWLFDPAFGPVLAVLFSVDDDDPLTPWDDSGGMDPRMIYISYLMGFSMPAIEEPLWDDVDALTIWREPLEPEPTGACCVGGASCSIETEADCLAMGGTYKGDFVPCFPNPCILIGDMNCDGVVDFFDIDAFVLAITNPAGYAAAYPGCDIMAGDANGDGSVDFFDIDGFVAIIVGP